MKGCSMSAWDNYEQSKEGGTAKEIRARVAKLKKQVAKDAKVWRLLDSCPMCDVYVIEEMRQEAS